MTSAGTTLSILICTVEDRAKMCRELLGGLIYQLVLFDLANHVEILHNVDDGAAEIGTKRNKLLRAAQGEYVCFIDDDDTVADDYVARLYAALQERPDCVTFRGKMIWRGKWWPFEHRLKYTSYRQSATCFRRPPNHLTPVPWKIAMRFPFPDHGRGEDVVFATAMARSRVLKTEVFIDHDMYFYVPSSERHRVPIEV